MLTPDELEGAGDDAAREACRAEGDLLDLLVGLLLGGAALSAAAAAAAMAVGTRTTRMLDMVDARMPGIRDAVRRDAEELARKSDERDRAVVGGPASWQDTAAKAADAAMRDLDALRLDMVDGAKRAYLEAVAKAAAQVQAGALTEDQATRQAVLALEEQGVRTVDYADTGDGAHRVSSSVDVAVRRAVRTHISREAGEATLRRCREYGTGLVEVSSHGGARPSHAVWQGRCYSLDGEREVDGVVYKDFRRSTGYGTGAGLCGWNCRHSFGPYRHGAPRQYGPNLVSETGYTDAELYALSQRQRACERAIRAAKRELVGARKLYESDQSVANQVAVEKARRKVADRQARVRKLVSDANAGAKAGTALLRRPDREWVSGYEGAGRSKASGRTLDDALARPSATKRIQSAGTSRTAVRKNVAAALANDGVSVRSFPSLTAKRQAAYIEAAIPKRLVDAKSRVREFNRSRSLMVTDPNMFLTANSRASWAASVAKAETKILEFAGHGYEIVKDHSGYKALSVLSSRGYVTVGAGALTHVRFDHMDENGRPDVTMRGIIDAIENPIGCTETKLDDNGLPSYKAVGRTVTVAINPHSGEVVTAWGTGKEDIKAIGSKRRRGR